MLFSVVGIVLFVVRKWSDCAILVTAILFLLQPVEWYHYILTANNIGDYNCFEKPSVVAPKEFTGAKVNKGSLKVTLPAKSIVVLEVK